MSTVVLIGNGVSIAYNPELAVPALTRRVFQALDGGTGSTRVFEYFAQRCGATGAGLEDVLGALDQMSAALPILQNLVSSGLASVEGANALADSSNLIATMYQFGVSHALEIIDGLAQGQPASFAVIEDLHNSLPDPDALTVATLNYDGLLSSALLEGRDYLFDLATGYLRRSFRIVDDQDQISGYRLRERDDLGARSLINLHGSMGWLQHPAHGCWRFPLRLYGPSATGRRLESSGPSGCRP